MTGDGEARCPKCRKLIPTLDGRIVAHRSRTSYPNLCPGSGGTR